MLRFTSALLLSSLSLCAAESVQDRIAVVTNTPGLVAFWDFTKHEAPGQRFTAHVPAGAKNDYALDAGNYVKDLWNAGPEATYADFPLLGAGRDVGREALARGLVLGEVPEGH